MGAERKIVSQKSAINNGLDPQDCRFAQFAQRDRRVRSAEDCRAGNNYLCSCGCYFGDVIGVDTAVNLDSCFQTTLVDHLSQATNSVERFRDKCLAAKT